jgi:hypothetical protein
MPTRQESEAIATVLLDTGPDGTRRACNNPYCLKDYQHQGECSLLTVKQACEVLNEAKWRGRDDWRPLPIAYENGVSMVVISRDMSLPSGARDAARYISSADDAIAIAQGIEDRRRVVELEADKERLIR